MHLTSLVHLHTTPPSPLGSPSGYLTSHPTLDEVPCLKVCPVTLGYSYITLGHRNAPWRLEEVNWLGGKPRGNLERPGGRIKYKNQTVERRLSTRGRKQHPFLTEQLASVWHPLIHTNTIVQVTKELKQQGDLKDMMSQFIKNGEAADMT